MRKFALVIVIFGELLSLSSKAHSDYREGEEARKTTFKECARELLPWPSLAELAFLNVFWRSENVPMSELGFHEALVRSLSNLEKRTNGRTFSGTRSALRGMSDRPGVITMNSLGKGENEFRALMTPEDVENTFRSLVKPEWWELNAEPPPSPIERLGKIVFEVDGEVLQWPTLYDLTLLLPFWQEMHDHPNGTTWLTTDDLVASIDEIAEAHGGERTNRIAVATTLNKQLAPKGFVVLRKEGQRNYYRASVGPKAFRKTYEAVTGRKILAGAE